MPIIRGPKQVGTELAISQPIVASPIVSQATHDTPPLVAAVVKEELARPAITADQVRSTVANAEPMKPFEGDLQQIRPEEATYRLGPYNVARTVTSDGHETITITSGAPASDAPGSITADKPVVMLELHPKGEGPAAMVVVGLIQPRVAAGAAVKPENPISGEAPMAPEEGAAAEAQKEGLT